MLVLLEHPADLSGDPNRQLAGQLLAELGDRVGLTAGLLALAMARMEGAERRREHVGEGAAREPGDQHGLGSGEVEAAGQRERELGGLGLGRAGERAGEQQGRLLAARLDELQRWLIVDQVAVVERRIGDQRDLALAHPAQHVAPGPGQRALADRRHPGAGVEVDLVEDLGDQREAGVPQGEEHLGDAPGARHRADDRVDVDLARVTLDRLGVGRDEGLGFGVVGLGQREHAMERERSLELALAAQLGRDRSQRRGVERIEGQQPAMVGEHGGLAGDLVGGGEPLVEIGEQLALLEPESAQLGPTHALLQARRLVEVGDGQRGRALGLDLAQPDQQADLSGEVLLGGGLVAAAAARLARAMGLDPSDELGHQRGQLGGPTGGLEHAGLGDHGGGRERVERAGSLGVGLRERERLARGALGQLGLARQRHADALEQEVELVLGLARMQQQTLEAAQRERAVVVGRGSEGDLELDLVEHRRGAVGDQRDATAHAFEGLASELALARARLRLALGLIFGGLVEDHAGVDPSCTGGVGLVEGLGQVHGVGGRLGQATALLQPGDQQDQRAPVVAVVGERLLEPLVGLVGLLDLELALGRDGLHLGGQLGVARAEHAAFVAQGLDPLLELIDRGQGVAPALGRAAVANHGEANREVVGVVAQRGGQAAIGLAVAVRRLEHAREQDQALDQVGLIADQPERFDGALELLLGLGQGARVGQDLADAEPSLGVIGVLGQRGVEAGARGRDVAGGPIGDPTDLGQEAGADVPALAGAARVAAGRLELGQLAIHQGGRAAEIAGVDPEADQPLDRLGQASGPPLRAAVGLGLGLVEHPLEEPGGPLGILEALLGQRRGLEQLVGIAERLEPVDEQGEVGQRAGELGLQLEQGPAQAGELARDRLDDGRERLADERERGPVLAAFVGQDLGQRRAELNDPRTHGFAFGLDPAMQVGEALAQQRDPLGVAIAASVESAEPERDLVVVRDLAGELLERLGRAGDVAEPLLQRAGLGDQQLDPLVSRRVGAALERGQARVEDRQELLPARGLDVELLQLGERARILGPQGPVLVPGIDRAIGQGQLVAVDLGDAQEILGPGVGVVELLVGGPHRVDRLRPLAPTQEQIDQALVNLGSLGEVADQEAEQLERLVAAIDPLDALFVESGELERALDPSRIAEGLALGVEQIGEGLDVLALALEPAVDVEQLAQRDRVAGIDREHGPEALFGLRQLVVGLVVAGDAQVERDDVLGQRGLAEQVVPGSQQAGRRADFGLVLARAAMAIGQRLEAEHALGSLGHQQERALVTEERSLDDLGALFPESRVGQLDGDLLLFVRGRDLGVGLGQLVPRTGQLGPRGQDRAGQDRQLGQAATEVEAGDGCGRGRGWLGQRDGLAAEALGPGIEGGIVLGLGPRRARSDLRPAWTARTARLRRLADHAAHGRGLELGRVELVDLAADRARAGRGAVELVELVEVVELVDLDQFFDVDDRVVDQLDARDLFDARDLDDRVVDQLDARDLLYGDGRELVGRAGVVAADHADAVARVGRPGRREVLGIELGLGPELMVVQLGHRDAGLERRILGQRGPAVVADLLGQAPHVGVLGLERADQRRQARAPSPGLDAGSEGVLGPAQLALVDLGELGQQLGLAIAGARVLEIPRGQQQVALPKIVAIGEPGRLVAGVGQLAAGRAAGSRPEHDQHAQPLAERTDAVVEPLLTELGSLAQEAELVVVLLGLLDQLPERAQLDQRADRHALVGALDPGLLVDPLGQLAQLGQHDLALVIEGQTTQQHAHRRERIGELVVDDPRGLGQGVDRLEPLALVGLGSRERGVMVGELAPELVLLGQRDAEVERLFGEPRVLRRQLFPGPAQAGERGLGIAELALVNPGDRTERVEAAERAVGLAQPVLAQPQRGVPELVTLGDGLDLASDLVVVGALAQRSLQVADGALGIAQAVLGDLGRVDQAIDQLEFVGEGLLLELALGHLEQRGPELVGLGQLAQPTEALLEVQLLRAGDEVAAPGPGERAIGVVQRGLGDLRRGRADVELAGDVAHLAEPVDPQLVDVEQLLPGPVGLGELLEVVAQILVERIDPAGPTQELERAVLVAEPEVGDLGHPPQRVDLFVEVAADELELARERAQGRFELADLFLQLGQLGVAVGVVGELVEPTDRRAQGRALVVHRLPGLDDGRVEALALVGVVGPEQEQLGVGDQLGPHRRVPISLEQAAVDVGIADPELGRDPAEHLRRRGRLVDLVQEDLGLLPGEDERLFVVVGQLAQAPERVGEVLPVVVEPIERGQGIERAAVVGADLDHAFEGRASQLGIAEPGLGDGAEPEQVVELPNHRRLARGRGLAEQLGQLLEPRALLVDTDDLVDDLEVVGLEVVKLGPIVAGAVEVQQLALGHPRESTQDLSLAAGLAGDLELALERRDQQVEIVGLAREDLESVQRLEIVAGQAQDLFAGPDRLGVAAELVVPELGHPTQQRDLLGVVAGRFVLLLEQLDDLVVIARAIVERGQGPQGREVARRELGHLEVELDRALRVDLPVAVDLGQALEDLEPLVGLGRAGQLGLLHADHVVPHARALLDPADLLARVGIVRIGLAHPMPGIERPVDVAEPALADLRELDELGREGRVVQGARQPLRLSLGRLIDLIEDQVAQGRPRVLAAEVILVALEGVGIEGLALEHLEVEEGRALVVVELVVKDVGGVEQAAKRDALGELLDLPLEQRGQGVPVLGLAIEPLERDPSLALGGLILAGFLVADPRLFTPGQPLVEVLGPTQQHRQPLRAGQVHQHRPIVIVELGPVVGVGEQLGQRLGGLVVIGTQRERAPEQIDGLAPVPGVAGQHRRLEEDPRGLGHAVFGRLARAQVELAERFERRERLRRGLDRRLQMARGAGQIGVLLRGQLRELDMQIADPLGGLGVGLAALRQTFELGQLGLHQLGRARPGASPHVQLDELGVGGDQGRVEAQRLFVVLDRVGDRMKVDALEIGVGDMQPGQRRGLVLPSPLHPPGQQVAELGRPVQLVVELREALIGAIVVGLDQQRAGQRMGGGREIAESLGEELVGLDRDLGDLDLALGVARDRGRVLDQELGHRSPVALLAQAPTRARKQALVARLLAIFDERLGVIVGLGRERAGEGGRGRGVAIGHWRGAWRWRERPTAVTATRETRR